MISEQRLKEIEKDYQWIINVRKPSQLEGTWNRILEAVPRLVREVRKLQRALATEKAKK